jgi:nitrous oxide reductase
MTPTTPQPGLSRRSVLRGAAGAGAAGLAVTALGAGTALAATGRPDSTQHADTRDTAANHARPGEPIVVHVRDAASGDIEVFSGTSQSRLKDRDLAARIAGAIKGR